MSTPPVKFAKIDGDDVWKSLFGKRVTNDVVLIKNMGDLHRRRNRIVFDAKKVYLYDCNKNFIFYWMDRDTFPNVKEIYLFSHPCENTTMHRFSSFSSDSSDGKIVLRKNSDGEWTTRIYLEKFYAMIMELSTYSGETLPDYITVVDSKNVNENEFEEEPLDAINHS
jgi:hypothetical protein